MTTDYKRTSDRCDAYAPAPGGGKYLAMRCRLRKHHLGRHRYWDNSTRIVTWVRDLELVRED